MIYNPFKLFLKTTPHYLMQKHLKTKSLEKIMQEHKFLYRVSNKNMIKELILESANSKNGQIY